MVNFTNHFWEFTHQNWDDRQENGECNQERDPPMLHGTTGIIVREVRIKKNLPYAMVCLCSYLCGQQEKVGTLAGLLVDTWETVHQGSFR